jgi:hypothetical protein
MACNRVVNKSGPVSEEDCGDDAIDYQYDGKMSGAQNPIFVNCDWLGTCPPQTSHSNSTYNDNNSENGFESEDANIEPCTRPHTPCYDGHGVYTNWREFYPDYEVLSVAFNTNVPFIFLVFQVSKDRYKNLYVSGGASIGYPPGFGGNISAGYLHTGSSGRFATQDESKNYLEKGSVSVSGGYMVGGGFVWSSQNTGHEVGLYYPGINLSYTYGIQIFNDESKTWIFESWLAK